MHQVIKRSCSVECGVFSEFVHIRKFIAFATPPRMTPVINLGHTATDGHRTSSPFHHNQDVRCRKLEHVSFVAVWTACAYLFHNHLTRIALTASANALGRRHRFGSLVGSVWRSMGWPCRVLGYGHHT